MIFLECIQLQSNQFWRYWLHPKTEFLVFNTDLFQFSIGNTQLIRKSARSTMFTKLPSATTLLSVWMQLSHQDPRGRTISLVFSNRYNNILSVK